MKRIKVVTSAHSWGEDEKASISLLEESDVRKIVRESLLGTQEALRQLQSEVDRNQEEFSVFRAGSLKNAESVSQEMSSLKNSMNRKEKTLQASIDNRMDSVQALFQDKGKEISDEFVRQCRRDVQDYFKKMSEYAKGIEKDIEELQRVKLVIEEQLKMSAAIADHLLKLYNGTAASAESGEDGDREIPSPEATDAVPPPPSPSQRNCPAAKKTCPGKTAGRRKKEKR